MPADGGGVEEDLGALHRGQARAFGKPLIPADQRADRRDLGLPRDEAGVAGREVELLVEQRIVGDVHLAIHAHQRAVGVDHRGGVVVHAGGALLEQRRDDHGLVFLRELARTRRSTGPGMRLGEREEAMVFDLAEVLRSKQLLRAEDLGALLQRLLGEGELVGEVPFRILAARHLREADLDDRRSGMLILQRPWASGPRAYLPCCIADRNSSLVLVLLIFESSSSIASTADSGVSTRRST